MCQNLGNVTLFKWLLMCNFSCRWVPNNIVGIFLLLWNNLKKIQLPASQMPTQGIVKWRRTDLAFVCVCFCSHPLIVATRRPITQLKTAKHGIFKYYGHLVVEQLFYQCNEQKLNLDIKKAVHPLPERHHWSSRTKSIFLSHKEFWLTKFFTAFPAAQAVGADPSQCRHTNSLKWH